MNKLKFLVLLISLLIMVSCRGEQKQTKSEKVVGLNILSDKAAEAKADSVLALMTLDEKLAYVGGDSIFFIRSIERLGLSSVMFTDATQGVHIRREFNEFNFEDIAMEKSTAFPAPIALASTWNRELASEYAHSIGEECRAGGIAVLLGPGMNIYRNSQCGRNFEYFGEDPFLAGQMIKNYVTGLQSTGTVATIKHFITNNTDFFRRKSNSIVDERTLHEIYMPAFKAGVDAGAKAAMTSYNLLNSEWCGQSDYVINHLLRGELGFKGLVMTDWWSVDDGEKVAKSGQDLEMPYTIALKNAKELLADGKITEADINRMVKSILKTCFKMDLYNRKPEKSFYNKFPQHVETALNTAREGIVLLKNENQTLPISSDVKNILVTGDFVEELLLGGGSGTVEGYDVVTMLEALKNEFGVKINFERNPSVNQIKNADIVLCNIGTKDSEGYDRPFDLPKDQEEKVLQCVNNNKNSVVIVTSGGGINMSGWNDKAAAIIYCWYAGQTGNVAIAEILSGKVNPSGKLPMSIEKSFKDSPAYGYMNGEDFYVGWNSEGEDAHPIFDIKYDEGVFVGYRWYEAKNIEPLYPFGYGLSYSKFNVENISVSNNQIKKDENLIVSLDVKNVSNIGGKQVVQVYVEDVESSVKRPAKELKGFQKVFVKANSSENVKIVLDKSAFSFWSPTKKQWVAEKGKFKIHVATSSKDIIATKEIELL